MWIFLNNAFLSIVDKGGDGSTLLVRARRKDDIGRVFPEVIWHAETPVLRTAPAPMFLLSGLVREHNMKVVITGEGADELLGGYDIFKEMLVRRFWARNPDSELRPRLLTRLYPDIAGMSAPGRVLVVMADAARRLLMDWMTIRGSFALFSRFAAGRSGRVCLPGP